MLPVVVVHGGAGHIPKERAQNSTSGVSAAARAGYIVLKGGGSSMDAVVEAVTQLENNPSFNAGCGSVLNVKGETSRACLTAEGAKQFARSMGVPEVPMESLITEYSRMRWRKNLAPDANPVECQIPDLTCTDPHVCVCVYLLLCVSGCGGYADNNSGAVSTTGHGEAIMKVVLARLILFYMEQGQSAEAASDSALAYMKSRVDGLGGVVTVDPQGNWAARFSSWQMAWAAAQKDTLHYGLYTGEHFTQSIDEPH
ncbi:isoaspartyl peptidase/L-asparaginase-like [Labrus mixtus]|uniref:isoaspartyl peptidase/L-asparaginase-like n=1 Tax=Labrus mixtus TaxID=508554 RepID=UPI0029C00F8C|nr:isoaspartyl peptidase/L-asparaginase-like [Labrus mixtus]